MLQRGQVIALELLESLDSKTARPGDKVTLKLTRDLTASGVVVLPKSTLVYGHVTADHPARNVCHDGRVEWKLDPVVLANGQKVKAEFVNHINPYLPIPYQVSLPPASDKIEERIGDVVLFPPAVALYGYMLLVHAESRCHAGNHPGREQTFPQNEQVFFAVSKAAKITQ